MSRIRYRRKVQKWYWSAKWKRLRQEVLHAQPMCQGKPCKGKATEATVVDHIVPHRGDSALFWKRSNLQALCRPCHDSWKRRQDVYDSTKGCDVNGLPNDPSHWWYQEDK